MNRLSVRTSALLLAFLMAATACGSSDESSGAPTDAGSEQSEASNATGADSPSSDSNDVADGDGFIGGDLNILLWEGYADSSFVQPFEDATGCSVSTTLVGSNDDFAPRLAAGGGTFDLITPSIDSTGALIEAGWIEPLDLERLPRYSEIYEAFRDSEAVLVDGETYGVPYVWGSISFMYRPDRFETAPTSIADLFAPGLEGRVSLWDDKSSIYVAARLNGDNEIYALSDEQLVDAQETLISQKPFIRKYWATAGELVELYASDEVWASNTWTGYQSALLADQGIEVVEFVPEENIEGWMDSYLMVKDSPNQDCAYAFLNYAISEDGQCGVSDVTGYSVANPVAAQNCMSEEQFTSLNQGDPEYLDGLLLWQDLGPRLQDYTNAWNAVKSTS